MAKVYDINSFESHLVSRGLAKNSIIAFVSDVKQFLDSNLDPESFLEDLKRKGCTNSTLMRKRASLINYYKFKEEPLDLPPIRVDQRNQFNFEVPCHSSILFSSLPHNYLPPGCKILLLSPKSLNRGDRHVAELFRCVSLQFPFFRRRF